MSYIIGLKAMLLFILEKHSQNMKHQCTLRPVKARMKCVYCDLEIRNFKIIDF